MFAHKLEDIPQPLTLMPKAERAIPTWEEDREFEQRLLAKILDPIRLDAVSIEQWERDGWSARAFVRDLYREMISQVYLYVVGSPFDLNTHTANSVQIYDIQKLIDNWESLVEDYRKDPYSTDPRIQIVARVHQYMIDQTATHLGEIILFDQESEKGSTLRPLFKHGVRKRAFNYELNPTNLATSISSSQRISELEESSERDHVETSNLRKLFKLLRDNKYQVMVEVSPPISERGQTDIMIKIYQKSGNSYQTTILSLPYINDTSQSVLAQILDGFSATTIQSDDINAQRTENIVLQNLVAIEQIDDIENFIQQILSIYNSASFAHMDDWISMDQIAENDRFVDEKLSNVINIFGGYFDRLLTDLPNIVNNKLELTKQARIYDDAIHAAAVRYAPRENIEGLEKYEYERVQSDDFIHAATVGEIDDYIDYYVASGNLQIESSSDCINDERVFGSGQDSSSSVDNRLGGISTSVSSDGTMITFEPYLSEDGTVNYKLNCPICKSYKIDPCQKKCPVCKTDVQTMKSLFDKGKIAQAREELGYSKRHKKVRKSSQKDDKESWAFSMARYLFGVG